MSENKTVTCPHCGCNNAYESVDILGRKTILCDYKEDGGCEGFFAVENDKQIYLLAF